MRGVNPPSEGAISLTTKITGLRGKNLNFELIQTTKKNPSCLRRDFEPLRRAAPLPGCAVNPTITCLTDNPELYWSVGLV